MTIDDATQQTLLNFIRPDALEAQEHMDVDQLTEKQRFALAYLAGVPHDIDIVDGQLECATTHLCGFIVVDGKWEVRSKQQNDSIPTVRQVAFSRLFCHL